MGRYLKRVFEVIQKEADRPLFVDGDQSVTYGEVEQESGKIYRYLKSKGIGKEDFVQIIVKKDIHFYSCMLGVWRAGAAFVINDAGYPKERLDFIGKDINAKIVLDKALFETIMASQEPMDGYEETDPHDACYAVYTSGSTGNPKGVLHEYGNLDQSMESFFPMAREYFHYKNGFVPPLNFVASVLESVVSTACAMTNYIISGEMLRDYNALTKFIAQTGLDRIYLPPSYIRIYKKPAESLKVVQTGSEPANGLYYEGGIPEIVNTYSMSESGFCVLRTILDKAYDVAPVGFPGLATVEYELIDDDGKVVEGAGQGELCFKNEYVRGYINLPEQTSKAFVNGMYHTADICRRDEKGTYFVVGRNDDMIKINGNRIEPAEIEAAVQKCGGLEKVIAKGFSDKKRSFIAVYYLEDEAKEKGFDQAKTAEEIKKLIPSYMLPTYYIPLKAFPINANGKLSKKDLPKPDDDKKENTYVEPVSEQERYFCEKMQEVLGVDRVGAEDDFYLIGGDSISAIKLVETCTEYDVSVHQIYELKTPRNLAKNCAQARLEEEEDLVIEGDLPLLPTQVQFLYYQGYAPDSAFLTMPRFQKLKEDVDSERLKGAVKKLLHYHPELCVKIRDDGDGHFVQSFEKAFLDEEPVEEIETAETDPERIKDLVNAPFSVFGNRLFRFVIIKNKTARYFWFALHHILTDGGSFSMLLNDLYELYNDEAFVPAKDRWFRIVQRQNEAGNKKGFDEAKEYFKKLFSPLASGISMGLKKDLESGKRRSEMVKDMTCFERKEGYDTNFFLTAVAVAVARYNGEDGAYVYSTFNGRYDRDTVTSAGFLITQLVAGLEVKEDAKPSELLSAMNDQMQFSMNHLEYNYMNETIGDNSGMVRFIYQKDTIYTETKLDRLSEELYEGSTLDIMSGIFSVNIVDDSKEDRLGLIVRYCPDVYKKESIDRFIGLLKDAVVFLEGANETERLLCDLMAKALEKENIGAEDDFFLLGGDSMRAIQFISSCNEQGLNVSTKSLYAARTPRALAVACAKEDGEEERVRLDDEARKKAWRLLPSQIASIATGGQPNQSICDIVTLDRLKPGIDPKRLAKASEKVLKAHPGLHVRMFIQDKFMQQFEPSYSPDIKILEVSEEEVTEKWSKQRPYNLFEERLYTCNILKTGEANYFYLSIHHAVSDGTSRKLILEQITKAYQDESYEVPRDFYFYLLRERLKEDRAEKPLPQGSTAHLIRLDHDGFGKEGGSVFRLGIAKKDEKRDGSFFAAALVMAAAKYNGCEDVRLTETSAGRSERYKADIVGELAFPMTIDVKVTDGMTFEDVRHAVREAEFAQAADPVNIISIKPHDKAGMRYIYQKNILDQGIYGDIAEKSVYEQYHDKRMSGTFSMNIIEKEDSDSLDAVFLYNTANYEKESMERLMDTFANIVAENL